MRSSAAVVLVLATVVVTTNSLLLTSARRSPVRSVLTRHHGAENPTKYEYIKDGSFDNSCKAQIPLKIAVAGGGIGGTFTAYALQHKGFDVTLFEKSSKFSRFGGPIQLASNALSCINALSPELFDEIMNRFTFTGTRKCGIKDGIRNTWYSVFDAITNLAEWNVLPYTGVIDRPDLQEVLLSNIKEGTVINSMGVKKYTENKGRKEDCMWLVPVCVAIVWVIHLTV